MTPEQKAREYALGYHEEGNHEHAETAHKAYLAGYAAGSAAGEWVGVEEHPLPEEFKTFGELLAWNGDNVAMIKMSFSGNWLCEGRPVDLGCITHYQALPTPPLTPKHKER